MNKKKMLRHEMQGNLHMMAAAWRIEETLFILFLP